MEQLPSLQRQQELRFTSLPCCSPMLLSGSVVGKKQQERLKMDWKRFSRNPFPNN
jgi:hypothetical protein